MLRGPARRYFRFFCAAADGRGPLPVVFLEALTNLKDLRFYGNCFHQHTTSKCGVMRTVSKPKELDD